MTCLAGMMEAQLISPRVRKPCGYYHRPACAGTRKSHGGTLAGKLDPQALQEIAAGSCLVCCINNPVYRSGTEGYHTFRIPAVIVSPQGDLLALPRVGAIAAPIRETSIWCLNAVRITASHGVLYRLCGMAAVTHCRESTPVVDETTGRIWLFMTHNLGQDTQDEIQRHQRRRPHHLGHLQR